MTDRNIFDLLPAVHRIRDRAQGDPLRALLAVIQSEVSALEDNIGQLYDDAFIETCQEWVVPYIGDLLGVTPLLPIDDPAFTQRGYVANTLGYRRRKGTVSVLEQLARDLTGWPAVAVEFFEHLATTQHVNHPRPAARATADLRDGYALQHVGSPFESVTHTADVRHIDVGRGRYNIPNVGIFLWRMQSYPLAGVTSRKLDAMRFAIDPLGREAPIFAVPDTRPALTGPTTPLNVPLPLTRRTMGRDLAHYYGGSDDPATVVIAVDGAVQPRASVTVCDLSDTATGWAHQPVAGAIALDPELGRVAFGSAPVGEVTASYAYGFTGDLGGGPYDKRSALAPYLVGTTWQAGVMKAPPPTDPRIKPTLADAVKEWNQQPPGSSGVIVLMESRTLTEDLKTQTKRIQVPEGSRLVIVSGLWPEEEGDDPALPPVRLTGRVAARSVRTHLNGSLEVLGTAPADSPEPGVLVLMGVLVEGSLTVKAGNLGSLVVSHTTFAPGLSTLGCELNPTLSLSLERSVIGDLAPSDPTVGISLGGSIVDGDISVNDVVVESSTILGNVTAQTLSASNSIFVKPVTIQRRQVGCVRYSYVPLSSKVPRRFRCQPEDNAGADRMFPSFASTIYGTPDYAVLRMSAPTEISAGAEGETEMGVWRFLQVPRRMRNLKTALDEYLRFGLEAGVFFAPQDHPAGESL
jgi:hypothetical protein